MSALDRRMVMTVQTSDDMTVHVMVRDRIEAAATIASLLEGLKLPPETPFPHTLTEVPATWECDGRDGCEVMA